MGLLDTLKQKYLEVLKPVSNTLSSAVNKVSSSVNDNQGWIRQGQFTPSNLWSTPVGGALASAQRIGNNFVQNPIPSIPIGQNDPLVAKFSKTLANLPLGMANNVLGKGILSPLTDVAQMGLSSFGGTPLTYDTARSAPARIGFQIAGKLNPDTIPQYGTKYGFKQIAGNLAGTASPILDAYAPAGGKQVVGEGLAKAGKVGFSTAFKQGMKEGGLLGAGYGLNQGLMDNRNVANNQDYAKNVGINTLAGGVFGALMGGVLKGAPEAWGQLKNVVSEKVQQLRPELSPAQAESEAVRYIKLESGRLAGSKPKFKDTKDVQFIGDLRQSLGLSRTGDEIPQPGFSIRSKTLQEHQASNLDSGAMAPQMQLPQAPLKQPGAQTLQQSIQRTLNSQEPLQSLSNSTTKVKGLVSRIQGSDKYPAELRSMLEGTYTSQSNAQTIANAKKLVKLNPLAAEARALAPQNAVDQAIGAELFNYHMDKGNIAKANQIINATSGTNEGQMIQILSQYDKTTPQGAIKFASNAVKSYNQNHPDAPVNLTDGIIQDLYATAKKVQAMPDGRERNIASQALIDKVSSLIPSSLTDKAITVWKAGLLTSLRTHERNLFGNTLMGAAEVAKDIPATLADKALSLATGKRTLTTTLSGRLQGAKTGAQAMVDVARLGFDPQESIQKFEVNKVNWANNPVEQFLKKATDAVYRPLAGEDKVFWHSAFAGSLYDQAGAAAINAGQRGNRSFVENLVKNPTEQMKITALNDANFATFHDKNALSAAASNIKRAFQNQPGLAGDVGKVATEILMPFTGVPSSIVGKTIAYSPIGLVKGAYTALRTVADNVPELQRQAAQEIGRGVLGTGLFGLGAYLMKKGLMTGQPKDAQEAAMWQAQNKPANSVLIGGKWRSINSVGPQALIALAGAKFQEEMNKPDGSVGNFALNLGKDQLSQTFLAGVQQPLNALTDPARYGKSYVGNMISSVVPNIVKDASKAFDPNARETNTPLDYLKQSLPGVRNTLLPKRDNLGNIVPQQPTGVGAFFDLFNSKTPIDNTVVNELARLQSQGENALPSKLTPSQTILKQKIKLTFDQLDKLEAGVGQVLKPQLEALITSPEYQSIPTDEAKAKAIDNLVSKVRTTYKNVNAGDITGGTQPTTQPGSQASKTYAYVDSMGNYKTVDLSPIAKPQLSGLSNLDTKKIASYNAKVSAQASDIAKLNEQGLISNADAEKMLIALKGQKITKPKKPAKPKALKASSFKMPLIKLGKLKKLKLAKIPKPKKITSRATAIKRIKVRKLSTKLARVRMPKIKIKGLA